MGRRRSLRSRFRLKLKPKTVMSISSLLVFGLAGLIAVSFFVANPIFSWLNRWAVGLFGWGAILVSAWLISLGYVPLHRHHSRQPKTRPVLGGVLVIIALIGLTASFKPQNSGLIGVELWSTASRLLTSAGAIVVLTTLGVIGAVVLFNTPFDEILHVVGAWLTKVKRVLRTVTLKALPRRTRPTFVREKIGPEARQPIRIGGSARGQAVEEKPKEAREPKLTAESWAGKLVQNLPLDDGLWQPPPLSLLEASDGQPADRGDIQENAAVIERTLDSFGIAARVVEVNLGPAVTQYALEIAMGTKLSRITALSDDLALALAAPTGQIRIEAPIPGRSLVGTEIPNRSLEVVTLRSILTAEVVKKTLGKLTFGLGLDVSGSPVVADLARMPHLLIAGSTGSGKSVCIHSIIASYLFRASPQEIKLILIDPKRVELIAYNGIPHLLTPVIVDIDQALSALRWAISEMERRYKLFAEMGSRNIDSFNETSGFQALPYLVIVIDELADMMVFAAAEFEDAITRLAQMARATGIHLVLSTQRPSTDVITGLIKANIPARIAFAVSSLVDSRVVIDTPGAEKLLGRGDMLFLPPDKAKPARIQGTFVSERDINRLVEYLRRTTGKIEYSAEVTEKFAGMIGPAAAVIDAAAERDDLFEEAVRLVCQADKASASLLQRRLKIGYARAARILDQLEAAGMVGPADGSKPREVLTRNSSEALSLPESE